MLLAEQDVIGPEHLPPDVRAPIGALAGAPAPATAPAGRSARAALAGGGRPRPRAARARPPRRGNRDETSRILGISRRTLSRMIQRWNLPRDGAGLRPLCPARGQSGVPAPAATARAPAHGARNRQPRPFERLTPPSATGTWIAFLRASPRPPSPVGRNVLPRRIPMFRTLALVTALVAASLSANALSAQSAATHGPEAAAGPRDEAHAGGARSKSDTTKAAATKPTAATAHHAAWTKDQIKEAQEGLTKAGLYKGKVDRRVQQGHPKALRAYQKENKLPVTGRLERQRPREAEVRLTTPRILPRRWSAGGPASSVVRPSARRGAFLCGSAPLAPDRAPSRRARRAVSLRAGARRSHSLLPLALGARHRRPGAGRRRARGLRASQGLRPLAAPPARGGRAARADRRGPAPAPRPDQQPAPGGALLARGARRRRRPPRRTAAARRRRWARSPR